MSTIFQIVGKTKVIKKILAFMEPPFQREKIPKAKKEGKVPRMMSRSWDVTWVWELCASPYT